MIAIVTAVLAALVSVAVGLPWAMALRRSRDDVVDLVTDSLLVGLVLTVTGLTLYAWIGWLGLALCVAVELGVVARHLVRRRTLTWPARPTRRGLVWIGVLVVLLVVALVLRRHTIDFITYTGDMGAYVNWANQFLRTGTLSASWPPFFPMFLVFGGLLTGAKGVTAVVALTGVLLVLGLIRNLRILGVNPWMALLAGGIVVVHPEAIWFSQIPLSESVNAPLVMLWLITVAACLTAERRRLWPWVFVGGVTLLALSLLRGTAPILMAPLVLVGVIALVVPTWRRLAPRIWLLVAANGAGAAVGYWYGLEEIPRYYVSVQIREILPVGLFTRLNQLHLLGAGPASLGAAVLVIVVLAAVYLVIRRMVGTHEGPDDVVSPGPRAVPRAVRIVEVVCAAFVVAALVESRLRSSEVWSIVHRESLVLVLVAAAAPVLLALTRHGRTEAMIAIMASVIAVVFLVLQTSRLEGYKTHPVFLYWDRYLFSEVFPVMMILVGIVLGLGLRHVVVRVDSGFVVWRRGADARQVVVTGAALVVVALCLVASVLPASLKIQKDTLLLGAGTIEAKLQAAMPETGQPFVWGTTKPGPLASSGFPNTWMAYGTPLAVSYGRVFANSEEAGGPFGPDQVLTEADLDTAMACTNSSALYAVEVTRTGPTLPERLQSTSLAISKVTTIRQHVTQLAQLPVPDVWHTAYYRLTVYTVTASAVPAAAGGCSRIPGA